MAAPWGGSSYSTAYPHPPPSAGRPYDDRSPRPQFPHPSIPGFYRPALPIHNGPGTSSGPPSSPPSNPGGMSMPIPSVLLPGASPYGPGPHVRSYSKDWFFENDPPRPPRPPRLQHTQSEPPPPLPRKPDVSLSQPPLPPKPSLSSPPGAVPQLYPKHVAAASSVPMLSPDVIRKAASISPRIRREPDEDEEFRRVLELSAQEAQRQASVDDDDEELARALRESMQTVAMPEALVDQGAEISPVIASPVEFPFPSTLSAQSPPPASAPPTRTALSLELPDAHRERRESVNSSRSSVSAQISEDEAMARRLAEQDRMHAERNSRLLPRYDEAVVASAPSPPVVPPQSSPSAAFPSAPPLTMPQHPYSSPPPHTMPQHPYSSPPPHTMPQHPYSSPPPLTMPQHPYSSPPPHTMPQQSSSSPPPSALPILRNRSQSAHAVDSASSQLAVADPKLNRSQSVDANEETSPAGSPSVPSGRNSKASSMGPPSLRPVPEGGTANPLGRLSQGPAMGNQYVDVELLRGVSLGFGVPVITKSFAPMQGPIPNVVALPYGKAPPFHILAPTWRGMLKLMARCASTRVEPTIEATALVKTPMKLRIVICFVKVHQSSTEWQTILFMTIDYAVPKGTQGWKHRIADPNTLPWSYTLSPPLAILRDGADAPMSKYYCVPSTQETPYPTLPITFPDLATYLTAVLEDSRRAMNDSSSGMRRLAKAIDTFYPNETPTDASEDRPGVRQKLLSFVGMGSKPQRDRNADTYELVTPFVPDDFGG